MGRFPVRVHSEGILSGSQCLLYSQNCRASEGGFVHELDPKLTHCLKAVMATRLGGECTNTRLGKTLFSCQKPNEVLTLTAHERQDMPVYFPPLFEVVSPDNAPHTSTYLILTDSARSSGESTPETSCAPVSIW